MRNIRNILLPFIILISIALPSSPAQAGTWQRVSFKMGAPTKHWEQIASCETGKSVTQIDWSKSGEYAGGLAIHHQGQFGDTDMGMWEMYGGEQFAPSPDKATKHEQVLIANRIANLGFKTVIVKRVSEAGDPILYQRIRYNKKPLGYEPWPCLVSKKLQPYYKNTYSVNLPSDKSLYCPKYEDLFRKYNLPVKVFSYIAYRESRCNPGAVNAKFKNGKITWTLNTNGTYDNGLLQINSSWFRTLRDYTGYEPEDLYDPEANALFASWILHNTSSRLGNWSIRTF